MYIHFSPRSYQEDLLAQNGVIYIGEQNIILLGDQHFREIKNIQPNILFMFPLI